MSCIIITQPRDPNQSRLGTFLYIFTHHQQSDLKCRLICNPQNSTKQNWANPKILLFWRMRFFNFFFNHMSEKYQNEKSPILNGQKSPKLQNIRKSPKMRELEGPPSFRPFENTRYNIAWNTTQWKAVIIYGDTSWRRHFFWIYFSSLQLLCVRISH